MVTKSGTNQFHGSAFGYERDRKLSAKDYFTKRAGTDKVPFSRQQYGGSVGGPIIQNRMFFFGAIEKVARRHVAPGAELLANRRLRPVEHPRRRDEGGTNRPRASSTRTTRSLRRRPAAC